MAIALVGATTGNSGTSQPASIPVTFDAAALAGHVAVIVLHTPGGAATVTDPSGWSSHVNGDGGNTKLGLWSKVLDAADITAGGITIIRSAGASYSWECGVFSGTSGFDALSAQQATTTGTTSVTIPAVTPVAANCLRLAVCAARVVTAATTSTASPPASWAEVGEAIDAHATNQRRLSFLDSIQLVGQAGVAQATATATTSQSVTYQSYSLTLAPLVGSTLAVAGAATTTPVAAAALTLSSAALPGFSQGFTKPAPFGVAVVAPPTPTPAPVTTEPARPIVEIGFTTDPLLNAGQYLHWDDPQRGWDVGLWAPDNIWTDVTPWLQNFSYRRGATRVEGPVIRYEAGTATVTLNNTDGRFHPLNLAGPYVSGTRTQVRPMVPIRIRAYHRGSYYELWRGFADEWEITYSQSGTFSQATVTATDAQKVIASKSRPAGPLVGEGELPGARIHRILTSVGWPTTDRLVDVGRSPLQATTLEGDPWAELLLVQDAELGEVYVDPNGKVVFKDRYAILTETLSTTSQAIFGRWQDVPAELPYESLLPSNSSDVDLRNVVRIGRAGGIVQEARDEASIAEFLEKAHERTDLLMQTDTDALAYAQYLLAASKDPDPGFAALTINPLALPDSLFPQVFGRDFGDRITIRSRPPVVGLIERDVFIRGIAGEYRGTNQWRWTWTLQSAERGAPGFVWDLSKWDSGAVWVY